MTAPASRSMALDHPIDLRMTLGVHQRGPYDPTMKVSAREVWRATQTPDGPATVRLVGASGHIEASAWGPGAAWALDAAPSLVGRHDAGAAGIDGPPVVRDLLRRFAGLRVGRTGAVVEALVPAILEQKVPGVQAARSFRRITRRFGEPAPGPAGLTLPVDPAVLAAQPYWELHRFGVERKRAEVLVSVCARSARLEALVDLPLADAYARLRSLPGIGVWTAAEVGGRALGDPDAVPIGDFHLPNLVSWALARETRGDDERMLELLEPFTGQRGRVLRLLELGVGSAPKFGPRVRLQHIDRI